MSQDIAVIPSTDLPSSQDQPATPQTQRRAKVKNTRAEKERKDKENVFNWTDDECRLLLEVTRDYKSKKEGELVDWESVRSKYDEITEALKEKLPESGGGLEGSVMDLPHARGELTAKILTTKLKAIRLKYRQAVDNGRRSGYGRVVMFFFELCEAIWGGSPATEKIAGGLETSGLSFTDSLESQDSESCTATSSHPPDKDGDPNTDSQLETSPSTLLPDEVVNQRRSLLDQNLKSHKQERLKRKLSADAQFLAMTREDLGLKREFLAETKAAEKKHAENFAVLSQTLGQLSQTMDRGFGLLSSLLAAPNNSNPTAAAYQPGLYSSPMPAPQQQNSIPWPSPAMQNVHLPPQGFSHYCDSD